MKFFTLFLKNLKTLNLAYFDSTNGRVVNMNINQLCLVETPLLFAGPLLYLK